MHLPRQGIPERRGRAASVREGHSRGRSPNSAECGTSRVTRAVPAQSRADAMTSPPVVEEPIMIRGCGVACQRRNTCSGLHAMPLQTGRRLWAGRYPMSVSDRGAGKGSARTFLAQGARDARALHCRCVADSCHAHRASAHGGMGRKQETAHVAGCGASRPGLGLRDQRASPSPVSRCRRHGLPVHRPPRWGVHQHCKHIVVSARVGGVRCSRARPKAAGPR